MGVTELMAKGGVMATLLYLTVLCGLLLSALAIGGVVNFLVKKYGHFVKKCGHFVWSTPATMVFFMALAVLLALCGVWTILLGLAQPGSRWLLERIPITLGGASMIACGVLIIYFANRRMTRLIAAREERAERGYKEIEAARLEERIANANPRYRDRLRLAQLYLDLDIDDLDRAYQLLEMEMANQTEEPQVYMEAGAIQFLKGNPTLGNAHWEVYKRLAKYPENCWSIAESRLDRLKEMRRIRRP